MGVSVDGRRSPSTTDPSSSATTTMSSAVSASYGHARWLDDEHAGVAVDAAHVAERQHDEAGSPERDVGRGDGRLEVGEGHRRQPWGRRPEPGRSARGIQTRIASTDRLAHAW